MKIIANDQRSWLSIEARRFDGDYLSCVIAAEVLTPRGTRFLAENADVHLLELPTFVSDLDQFVMDRSIEVKAQGTENSGLRIFGTSNRVYLEVQI